MLRDHSPLFQPGTIGTLQLPNRFIASAISYRDSDQYGFPSVSELNHIQRLARGGVGLIIPGNMFTTKVGRNRLWQNGFASTCHADAWKDIIKEVHSHGTKIIFQVAHGGIAAEPEAVRVPPKGPSAIIPGSKELTIPEIEQIIQSYVKSAKLIAEAGGDGIQLQCAHGFLLSQFLSPLTNKRHDGYGGSVANRTRIIREIVQNIRKLDVVKNNKEFAVTIKINGDDVVKQGGFTPEMCGQAINILGKIGVDMFEITSGFLSPWNTVRGQETSTYIDKDYPLFETLIKENSIKSEFKENYNVDSLKIIRNFVQHYLEKDESETFKFSVVGGLRNFQSMEKLVNDKVTDFVSLGRPLLKDPFLIEKFYYGKVDASDCDNCNICYTNPPYINVHCPKSKVLPLK